MKKISSLSQLENPESFAQVNFLKGFRYIDSAGEIINRYQADDTGGITYNMSPDQLIIGPDNTPKELSELRISNRDFWAKFSESISGKAVKIFATEAKAVLKITGVKQVMRVGLRRRYVFESTQKIRSFNDLFKPTISPKLVSMIYQVTLAENMKAKVDCEILSGPKGKTGILFDIDIAIEEKTDIAQLQKTYLEVFSFFESEEILKTVNSVLEGLRK